MSKTDSIPVASTRRFLPLDVFRGMTVCLMIIVNSPGTWKFVYPPLEHAAWHGLTVTDLVFPSFLFAVGNAISFTMGKYEALGNKAVLQKIFTRTAIIFIIGFLLGWLPFFRYVHGVITPLGLSHTRILGVLQRIALCYCAASLMIHYLPRKIVIAASVLFLLGYWAILFFFGVPGDPYSLHGNAILSLDRLVMGESHLYRGEGFPFDPEGILSTIPSVVNVIAGYYTGIFIQKRGGTRKTLLQLALAGAGSILVATLWNIVFPINKKIWTSPYVLVTVGIDLLVLAILIEIIERRGWTKWTDFFTVFGKNTLFIYVLSEFIVKALLYIRPAPDTSLYGQISDVFQSFIPGEFGSLLFAITVMLLCWGVGKVLDWKKIYIKV